MFKAIIFVMALLWSGSLASASVCNDAKNIDSPEQCHPNNNSQCCQWEYWFEGLFCTERWCYSYDTCEWKKFEQRCYYSQ